jgi:hypothetical protein
MLCNANFGAINALVDMATIIKNSKDSMYIGFLRSLMFEMDSENLSNALYMKNDNNTAVGIYNINENLMYCKKYIFEKLK